jgi:hypothetical protein
MLVLNADLIFYLGCAAQNSSIASDAEIPLAAKWDIDATGDSQTENLRGDVAPHLRCAQCVQSAA